MPQYRTASERLAGLMYDLHNKKNNCRICNFKFMIESLCLLKIFKKLKTKLLQNIIVVNVVLT